MIAFPEVALAVALCLPLLASAQDQNAERLRLRKAVETAWRAHDEAGYKAASEQYVQLIKDSLAKDDLNTLDLARGTITSSHDKVFAYFLTNAEKLDALAGNDRFAAQGVGGTIYNEEIAPSMGRKGFDWGRISATLKAAYPTLGDKLVKVEAQLVRRAILNEIKEPLYSVGASSADWSQDRGCP